MFLTSCDHQLQTHSDDSETDELTILSCAVSIVHCDPKTSLFFSLWFPQTLTNFYNIWQKNIWTKLHLFIILQ